MSTQRGEDGDHAPKVEIDPFAREAEKVIKRIHGISSDDLKGLRLNFEDGLTDVSKMEFIAARVVQSKFGDTEES